MARPFSDRPARTEALSLRLSEEEVAAIDAYRRKYKLASRVDVVRRALGLLVESEGAAAASR